MRAFLKLSKYTSLAFFIFWSWSDAYAEISHPSLALEPILAEATIHFQQKNYSEALVRLDEALKIAPKDISALEMKALIQKLAGEDRKSYQTYAEVIKLKKPNERAPIHFELGTILFQNQKFTQAIRHFEASIAGSFNIEVSHFFLGLSFFQLEKITQAEHHFQKSALLNNPEIQMASLFYIGLIRFRRGDGVYGIQKLKEATSLALSNTELETSKQILEVSQSMTENFTQPQLFSNLTLLGQYDTNLTESPNATVDASNKKSAKLLFLGSIGYSSSSAKKYQWSASYRFNGNRNLKKAARNTLEYLGNTLNFTITKSPLQLTNYGLRLEGNYSFQNRTTTTDLNEKFRPFSRSLEISPFIRYRAHQNWFLSGQISAKTTDYDQDPATGDARRNGWTYEFQTSSKHLTKYSWMNPQITLGFTRSQTQGITYRSSTWDFGLSNNLVLSPRDTVTPTLGYSISNYSKASPSHKERVHSFGFNYLRVFSSHWSALASFSFSRSNSNQDSLYTYDRTIVSAGLNYTF